MLSNSAPGRLLIVDDDPLLRGMAAKTLRHAGFDVEQAEDGTEGLALFAASTFDLLLLDVMMPDLDGFEVCTQIRGMPHGARVPILMLTGLDDTASIELAYQAGATDFIAKPINWTLLSHRVRYSLRAGAAVESAIKSRERLERAQHIATMGGWEIATETAPAAAATTAAVNGVAAAAQRQRFIGSPELARVFAAPPGASAFAGAGDFLARVCEADRSTVQAARQAAVAAGKPYQLTFGVERFDGAPRTVFEQAAAVYDATGRQTAVEGITQDITDRIDAERRITQLARYDALTGLANRQFFAALAGPALERSLRLGTACALLHVDMDRFKTVNDAVGHAAGDTVLRIVAERLHASIRTSDIAAVGGVSGESLVARVGANAFTLLLVDVGSDQQVTLVADRLLRAVAMPVPVETHELVLTASIGIAMYPRDAGDAGGLSRCAEQAVFSAKAAGRAQHRFFDETMNTLASARLAREGELRRAIGDGQLRLYYQPKVDAASGKITGAEALVRWQHPELGLVPPAQFVPLAEECGLILPMTAWVLETACADLRSRADAGLPTVPVSVNLASPSFADDALPGQLDVLLARHRLPPAWLVLEVTESQLMSDVDRAVARLQALRDRGFHLSLDDFGTGYSSLNYLKRFPIDELKIDRSFVTDVCRGGRDGAIAASIIALAREFGLQVVAEGVETPGQSAYLLAQGCPQQQGFLFSRPVPAPEFAEMLIAGCAAATALPAEPQTETC